MPRTKVARGAATNAGYVFKREKRDCKQKQCEEQGGEAAPLPVRIIDKSLFSDQIIIDTVVSKYADHSPLYRQSAILLREAGVDISRSRCAATHRTTGRTVIFYTCRQAEG